MSWFPNIPVSKFGTKEKKEKLTNENKKAIKDKKRRGHTIKYVKKQRQKMDLITEIKINNIKNIKSKFGYGGDNINILSAKCVHEGIFENAVFARIFIKSFKEKIFN